MFSSNVRRFFTRVSETFSPELRSGGLCAEDSLLKLSIFFRRPWHQRQAGDHIPLHTKRFNTESIPKQFRLIPTPILPNTIPRTIRSRIRYAHAHNRDLFIPETKRFGNHRTRLTEHNSKIVKFGFGNHCVMVQSPCCFHYNTAYVCMYMYI